MRDSRPFLPYKNKDIKDEIVFEVKLKNKNGIQFPAKNQKHPQTFQHQRFPNKYLPKKFIEFVKLPKQKTFN
jgi:hypothetical protein